MSIAASMAISNSVELYATPSALHQTFEYCNYIIMVGVCIHCTVGLGVCIHCTVGLGVCIHCTVGLGVCIHCTVGLGVYENCKLLTEAVGMLVWLGWTVVPLQGSFDS